MIPPTRLITWESMSSPRVCCFWGVVDGDDGRGVDNLHLGGRC